MKKYLSLILVFMLLLLSAASVATAQEPIEEPTEEPAVETAEEPEPAATDEPAPEVTDEPAPEVTDEPAPEVTDEPAPEVTDEPAPEVTDEPAPEVTDEPAPAATDEPASEPTEEPTEEATAEPTTETTVEPIEEPTEEPTEESIEDSTVEPIAEPTEEPVEEATAEPTTEPAAESADVSAAAAPAVPSGGVSGVTVVNLESSPVTLLATYYAEDGTQYTLQDQTLTNKGDSLTYYDEPGAKHTDPDPASFMGATIISANGRIAASANTIFNNGLGVAYGGSGSGSTSVLLPLVLREYFGTTSWIGIQNTDTTSAKTAVVTFTPQGQSPFQKEYLVQPGASRLINLADESGFVDNTGGNGWLGFAVVTPKSPDTTEFVSAVFNYSNNFVYGYTGFSDSGSQYYLPLIRSSFANKVTGVNIADANTASNGDTTITVAYDGFVDKNGNFGQDAGEAYTCDVQATLPDNESLVFYNSDTTNFTTVFGGSGAATVVGGDCQANGDANFGAAGGKFVGSATLTASGSTSPAVAVVVNDQSLSNNSSGAYNGFLSADGGTEIIAPVARSSFFGYTTGTSIQEITGNPVTVEVSYSTSVDSVNPSTPNSRTIDLNGFEGDNTIYLPADWTTGTDATHGTGSWLGSVTIKVISGNGKIVGITNDEPSSDSSVFNLFKVN